MKINYYEDTDAKSIEDTYQVSTLSSKLLATKHLDMDSIKELLFQDDYYSLENETMLYKVKDRLLQAIEKSQKILICGDYDCDGICATTILYGTLLKLGADVGYYIPNRIKEGYGLSANTVQLAHEKGYDLLITVDNGVKAFEAMQEAKRLGIELIVSDHHAMHKKEITCDILLHSFEMQEAFHGISGAGIAFELSRVLIGENPYYATLAGIATLADVMPLRKEGRILVKKALMYLNMHQYPTIKELTNYVTSWDEEVLSFQVIPKINATGRLSDIANANNTVKYLLLESRDEIARVAKQIVQVNETRKEMSEDILKLAKENIENLNGFYMVYGKELHEGIVGLVAGKLAEEYQAPVMVLCDNSGELKGSIRSYGLVDLTTFFAPFADKLLAFGGHRAAAGIGIEEQHLPSLKEFVKENYTKDAGEIELQALLVDASLVTFDAIKQMKKELSPFGNGFEKVVVEVQNQTFVKTVWMSGEKHVKLVDVNGMECLLFSVKEEEKAIIKKGNFKVLGTLSTSTFRGITSAMLQITNVIERVD